MSAYESSHLLSKSLKFKVVVADGNSLFLKIHPSYICLIDNLTTNSKLFVTDSLTRMEAACPCVLLLHLPCDIKTL